MRLYDLVAKYGKGAGESKMWESTQIISDFIAPMEHTNKQEYWCLLRNVYGIMSNGHYNEEFAMHDVGDIEYTNKKGEKKQGAYWTVEQVEEAMKNYPFPSNVNKWDKFVAANIMHSDLCKKLDDVQVLDATFAFFFSDEDWKGQTKIWDYMCCKYAKK